MGNKKITMNKTKDKIVSKALDLFIENGIENVKMTDIADKSKVGVASVYRYFGTKKAIAIEAGVKIWKKAADFGEEITKDNAFDKMTGFEQITAFGDLFCKAFESSPNFFKFLRAFDVFMEKEKEDEKDMSQYEKSMLTFKDIMLSSYEKGVLDFSVKNIGDFNLYYFTVARSLISLSEKLICLNDIVESDKNFEPVEQIRTLVEISLNYLKK